MTAALTDASSNVKVHLQQLGISPLDSSPFGIKAMVAELPDTSDGGGTFVFSKKKYGISNIWDVRIYEHSTTDDVVITAAFTTSVTGDAVTITFPDSSENVKRVIIVWGI